MTTTSCEWGGEGKRRGAGWSKKMFFFPLSLRQNLDFWTDVSDGFNNVTDLDHKPTHIWRGCKKCRNNCTHLRQNSKMIYCNF